MARPKRPTWRLVLESLAAAVIGFGAVVAVLLFVRNDDGPEQADVPSDSLSVLDVISGGSAEREVVATGFVFVGETRSILCEARDDGDPPFCDGNAIDVLDLDTTRIDLVIPDDHPAYSRDEVTLAGHYSAGVLRVREILQTP